MVRKIIVTIAALFIIAVKTLSAQQPYIITDSLLAAAPVEITPSTVVLVDSAEKPLTFADLNRLSFIPYANYLRRFSPVSNLSLNIVWIRLLISNNSSIDSIFLDLGKQGEILLYSNTGALIRKTGAYYFPYNSEKWKPVVLPVRIGEIKQFYLKVTNKVRPGPLPIPTIHTAKTIRSALAETNERTAVIAGWMFFIAGCLFAMSLFGFTQFFFRKDHAFLSYAIFCMVAALSMIWNSNYQFGLGMTLEMKSANQIFAYVIAISYALFMARMISVPSQFPKLWRALQLIMFILVGQISISVYEFFNGLIFYHNSYYVHNSTMILVNNILLYVCLLFSKVPIKKYLLVGATFLWIPNFVIYFGMVTGLKERYWPASITNYLFGMGIFFENFFFLLALAFRNHLMEKENRQMQMQYNQQLENEIDKKSTEIQQQQNALAEKRVKEIEKTLQQQIAQTEIAALKAQMNPHFIFNCLNSIDAFIYSNDKDNATLYLNKFAKLIRNILDSSKENLILFSKDIETLKLYLELEELRHERKFKIVFTIEDELLNSDLLVPPLIIQPFVENAILHGLKNKAANDGVLRIEIKSDNKSLIYCITDNGIGREAASKLATNKVSSYGMQMTLNRIRLFNKEEIPSVDIKDLVINGCFSGTVVLVSLKEKHINHQSDITL